MGVTRAVAHGGTKWAGVFLISPVIEAQIIGDADFIEQARHITMLIVHGEKDDRISASLIKNLAGTLEGNGALVTEHYYPDEDHFLFFSQPDAVVADMIEWMPETK